MRSRQGAVDKDELVARARFRHHLRLFERYTEESCAEAGVTLSQYLLLLQVAGRPDRDWALVGELAECMVVKHHTAVELAGRCEAAGLVSRERDPDDQRKVRVVLTPSGRRAVERVAGAHREELRRLEEHLAEAVDGTAGVAVR